MYNNDKPEKAKDIANNRELYTQADLVVITKGNKEFIIKHRYQGKDIGFYKRMREE